MSNSFFDFHPTTRVVFGNRALGNLGEIARNIGARRVLLVTDPGVAEAGHVDQALKSLDAQQLQTLVFDDIIENPTTVQVERGTAYAREAGPLDLIIGLGGGSAMDCAKGINFLLSNGGKMSDYWGYGKATKPMLPAVGVPTTAGTGSEAQSYALICRESDHRKMACGDRKARFHTVILDPVLLRTIPATVAGVTVTDAVSHALESYVCTRRNPVSQMFAREAWRHLNAHFEAFLQDPGNEAAAGHMLLGAHFSGMAIENAMLGAAHATANPLTSNFNITHGIAVGIMLPHVIRLNAGAVGDLYLELSGQVDDHIGSVQYLIDRLARLGEVSKLPGRLRDVGISEAQLADLTAQAAEQWTGTFNPVPLTSENITGLYRDAW